MSQDLLKLAGDLTRMGTLLLAQLKASDAANEGAAEQIAQLSKVVTDIRETQSIGINKQELAQSVHHILSGLMNDKVWLASFASNIFAAGIGALQFQAGNSKDRNPRPIITEQYVPGSMRIVLTQEGRLIAEVQESEAIEDINAPWAPSVDEHSEESDNAIILMMQSYGVQADSVYYFTTDLDVEAWREKLRGRITTGQAALNKHALAQAGSEVIMDASPAEKTFEAFTAAAEPALTVNDELTNLLGSLEARLGKQ